MDATTETCDTMYQQFYEEALKSSQDDDQVWQMVQEYEQICSDHLSVLEELKRKRSQSSSRFDSPVVSDQVLKMLRLERNTWRLVHRIFLDRVSERQHDQEEEMMDDDGAVLSDREVVDKLYSRSCSIRQMQLVIDWLEDTFSEDMQREQEEDKMEFYSDGPHFWENSLHFLKEGKKEHRMDPDAGFKCPKELHELDREDETRLLRFVFRYLRAGQLDSAIDLASKLGYHWLAGTLQGWMLHHDPNLDPVIEEVWCKKATDGNPRRDLFKYVCWTSCQTKNMSLFEKAVLGLLSGNTNVLLPVCVSWSDKMWAYFKTSLDVKVEQELRSNQSAKPASARLSGQLDNPGRASIELPTEYWTNNKSPEDMFRELEGLLTDYCWSLEERYHFLVQKLLICNDINGLVDMIQTMCRTDKRNELASQYDLTLLPQMIRFFSHLLLFLSSIGFINQYSTDVTNKFYLTVLETYVNLLIDRRHIPLVAFYVSKLPTEYHVQSYTRLLLKITDKQERKACLEFAKNCGLNVNAITKRVVECMRETKQSCAIEASLLEATLFMASGSQELEAGQLEAIHSLEWLSLGQVQYIELLRQSNSLLRSFILSGRIEAAEEVFRRCPSDLTTGVRRAFTKRSGIKELSLELKNWERELFCFSAFFQAREAFSDWISCYSQQPRQPIKPANNSTRFTDKMAFEHRTRAFESEMMQWREILKRQAAFTADKLRNVVLFPDGGWMKDPEGPSSSNEEAVSRTQELAALRRVMVPQVCLLLLRVLSSSGLLSEAIQVADLVASDIYQLHMDFNSQQMTDLMHRVTETSVSALNEGLDPFGYSEVE